MTLLDLIRNLHADGKPVLDFDLFVCDSSAYDMEDVVRMERGYEIATGIDSPYIPPQYIELGDNPRYLYVRTFSEYSKLTAASGKFPARFPRLLVGIFSDRTEGFFTRYKGKNWREIPPIELLWLSHDFLSLLALDKDGNCTDFVYDNEIGADEPATFYTVRSEYGSDFAWLGDIARDPLPEGLCIVDAG